MPYCDGLLRRHRNLECQRAHARHHVPARTAGKRAARAVEVRADRRRRNELTLTATLRRAVGMPSPGVRVLFTAVDGTDVRAPHCQFKSASPTLTSARFSCEP